MHWLFSILLIIVGALAAYTGIVRTWPNLRQGLWTRSSPIRAGSALSPWSGAPSTCCRSCCISAPVTALPAFWLILALAANVVAVLLGLILGYGLIAQYLLTSSPDARRKGEECAPSWRPARWRWAGPPSFWAFWDCCCPP